MPDANGSLSNPARPIPYFPVRIRVAADLAERDRQFDLMCRWLDATIGRGQWWHVEERDGPMPDCFRFCFLALADADAFVGRFSLGILIRGAHCR